MPARDWERIKTAFDTAKSIPEGEMDEVLQHLCPDDPSMVAFVRNLIRNDRDCSATFSPSHSRVFQDGTLVAGRLRVIRFIDSGSMGEVYEAYDQRLHIKVAIKTLRTDLVCASDALARFEREIRMAREVTHPNLCRVFDFIEHLPLNPESPAGPIPCYTMELIEGESLAACLVRERPLDPAVALPLLRQIASGLDALHDRGIIHRDLKPSNIMLARNRQSDSRVVLMDFGLAKLLESDEEMFQTRTDLQAGAPYFMAPELLRNGSPSVASDLYAFGLIADEMVTHSRAFSAQSLQSLYFAKLWEAPIPPSERSGNLPGSWHNAILRAISFQPEDRYSSAAAMIEAIAAKDSGVAVSPPRAAPLPPWTRPRLPRALEPISRRPVLFGGAGVALLGFGMLLTVASREPDNAIIQVYDIENATGNPGLNYLCKGTTNELIRRLSLEKTIRVIPMRETRTAANKSKPGRIAIEGIMQGSDDRIRLSVLLVDNRTGETFDSEKFDKKAGDLLQVENDLAGDTVLKIEKHLVSAKFGSGVLSSSISPLISQLHFGFLRPFSGKAGNSPTSNGPAFDDYMRGRQLFDEYSQPSVEAAITYLRKATEEDPSFALGHATLAEALLNFMTFTRKPQQDTLEAAHRSAGTAITLDPMLPEAQAAQAYVLQAEWDWQGAEVHFQKALSLKPGYAAARRRYAGLLLQFGRVADALPLAEQAFSEDPYDRGAIPGIGLYYFLAGRYEDSIRFLETQIGENDMQAARHNLGDALAEAACTAPPDVRRLYFERALAQAARVTGIEQRVGGMTPMGDEMYAHYLTLMHEDGAAERYLARLLTQMKQGLASPANVAWIYALRGDKDKALDLLETAMLTRDRRLLYVKLLPALKNLHGDPRFQAILTNMKLQ